jgi:hypothetical protein
MIKNLLCPAIFGLAAALPEPGCYYYKVPIPAFTVESQIEIKDASNLDFSVYMDAAPLKIVNQVFACSGESYEWDDSNSEVIIGLPPISQCLTDLTAKTAGAVDLPVAFVYDDSSKSLSASFAGMPVQLVKIDVCKSFEATTTTSSPAGTTVTTPGGAADNPTQPTTKGIENVSMGFLVICILLSAL